jgi:hypothetical protein
VNDRHIFRDRGPNTTGNIFFAQALPAAATLYLLAGQITHDMIPDRAVATPTALEEWQGAYAQDFVEIGWPVT